MNSFDHKNRKENYGATRSRNDRSETSFNREDSRRSTREENALSTFSRDKRPAPQRTSTTEDRADRRADSGKRITAVARSIPTLRKTTVARTKSGRHAETTLQGPRADTDTTGTKTPNLPRVRDIPSPAKPFNRTNGYKSKNTRHADTEQYGTGYKRRPNRRSGGFSTTSHREAYPRFEAPKPQGAIRLNRFIANSGSARDEKRTT